MSNFKIERIDSPKHLTYIRSLDCFISDNRNQWCNGKPIHAHHLTCVKGARGIGQKVGDNLTLPLCQFHHRTLHDIGEKKFWKMWDIDAERAASKLWEENNAIYSDKQFTP